MSKASHKVVVTDLGYASYEPESEELAGLDTEMVLTDCSTEPEVGEACRDADGVLTRLAPVGAEAIAMMEKCRVISRYGVGVDNVDIEAATKRNMVVANVRDYCNEEVSDHALALLMACARKTTRRDKQVRAGQWDVGQQDPIYRIAGKVLGLVGYGAIARTLHRKVSGFNFSSVLVHDPYVTAENIQDAGGEPAELETLCKRSDYISVHVPLNESTHHLIGTDLLGLMKPTAILVNTSRGAVVDNDALYEALKEGSINSAGLDVHEQEPPPADSPFFELGNVVLTDHTGWYSEESQEHLQRSAAKNVARVLSGEPPLFCVNPKVLD